MENQFYYSRAIDKLGRIVVPMEFRRRYGIKQEGKVKMLPTENGILLQPDNETEEENKNFYIAK